MGGICSMTGLRMPSLMHNPMAWFNESNQRMSNWDYIFENPSAAINRLTLDKHHMEAATKVWGNFQKKLQEQAAAVDKRNELRKKKFGHEFKKFHPAFLESSVSV